MSEGGGRRALRYLAAALSIAMAAVYLLIGLEVIKVVDGPSSDAPSMLVFGGLSAAAFVVGAVLLTVFDRRILWALGGLFQIFAIAMYFAVAPQRDPSYEPWGIGLKIGQGVLLLALAYLALRAPAPGRFPTAIRSIPR